MTIKGQSATAHFHTDQNKNKAQTFMFNTSKKLKGFWFYFTGQYVKLALADLGGARPPPPTGPDSFVLTCKFFET